MGISQFVLSPWFWLLLMILFSVVELLSSLSLTTIWFAISALVMVFVSALTGFLSPALRFKFYIGLFLAIAFVLLIFTRKFAIKKFKTGSVKTNIDELTGLKALVTKKIAPFERGEVKVKGQIWSALSEDNTEIPKGAECVVQKIEGVKLIVTANLNKE